MDALRPFLSRLIAGWLAALAVYLQARYSIVLDVDTQAALLSVGLFIFTTIYSIVHRLISKKTNPGDAASSHLAVQEKSETESLKNRFRTPRY